MNRLLFLLLISCLFCLPLSAQDSLLRQALLDHQYHLQLDRGILSGDGADWLSDQAAAGQFVLIGEDHGIAELPKFTAALYQQIQSDGYRYFATETGPFSAALLQKLGQRESFIREYRDTLSKYPWAIPFYTMQEEVEMIESILEGKNQEHPIIWGLDQEFIGSPRLFFPTLLKHAADDAGRAVVREYADRAMEGFKKTMTSKNPGSIFFYSATPDDFARLRAALNEDPEANRLLDELEQSWMIYHLYFTGKGYASNKMRAEMMKRHFWSYYQQARTEKKLPKVVFKFGANHMYRGANGLNVFDIGNFVSELASREGTASCHLYVIGKRGFQNAYTPFADESAKQQAYDPGKYLDRMDVRTVLDLTGEEQWSLFDLRPLRSMLFNGELKNLDPALEKVIWSYDAFVVIPETHASKEVLSGQK